MAERLAAVKEFYAAHADAFLPVTRKIIGGAARYSAVDAFEGIYRLQALKRQAEAEWAKMDVLLIPTTGTIYTIEQVEADPIALNTNLGYYTNFVNLLDLAALALPSPFRRNGLPSGVTLIAPALADGLLWPSGRSTTPGWEPVWARPETRSRRRLKADGRWSLLGHRTRNSPRSSIAIGYCWPD